MEDLWAHHRGLTGSCSRRWWNPGSILGFAEWQFLQWTLVPALRAVPGLSPAMMWVRCVFSVLPRRTVLMCRSCEHPNKEYIHSYPSLKKV